MAGYPYGLALSSYLEAFDRSQQLAQARQLGQLREASVLQSLTEADRKRQEEEQVMRDLSSEIAARRAQPSLQPNPQIVPAIPPVEGGPDIGPGLPGQPRKTMAPMLPETRPVMPFGASLTPERQAAVLASPKARPAIQSLEEQEKEAERRRLREEARQIFDVGVERLEARDIAGGSMELAKAYTRLGQHDQAGFWHKTALKLLEDKEEAERSSRDWEKYLTAQTAYKADPSLTNFLKMKEAMSSPESATFRGVRQELLKNELRAAVGQDWRLDLLKKKVGEVYADAWGQGKEVDLREVLKGIQAQNPELLFPVLSDTLEKGGKLHDVVVKDLLRVGEDIDPSKMTGEMRQAMDLFRLEKGRGPRTAAEYTDVIAKARDLLGKRKAAEQTPEQREIQQLNLEMKRKAADGKLTPKDASLMVQRWDSIARNAETPEDAEIARSEMRFWMEHAGKVVKDMGGEVQKRKVPPAQQILKGRKLSQLSPEEKQAVIHAEAKRLFPAKVVEYADIAKKLSKAQQDALFRSVEALETSSPTSEPR